MRFATGITARTTQLAWTITLITLSIFVAFIIPEQKQTLQEGLESKAQGVGVALQGEVAGAAISEDYSSVVEHAMQVVAGDPAVEFLVITKNDGYSVIVDRKGWRSVQKIAPDWFQGARTTSSKIEWSPLFNERAFHYSVPFDYNGLEWGWIHVGLSLESYDRSVKAVYLRTGVLAVICIVISLIASMLFAKRYVQPVLRLRSVVERVARGDLAARADIRSNDEIEQLAEAFNGMADAVLHRNRIVESVRYTAQSLQGAYEWTKVIDGVVSKIGHAANASRVLLIQNIAAQDSSIFPTVHFEWAAAGVAPYGAIWSNLNHQELGLEARIEHLSRGQMLVERRAQLESTPIPGPAPQSQSTIAAPILVGDSLWGALVVQDCCQDRDWLEAELDSARAVADMLGASIMRQHAQEALVEAKRDLEERVIERTRELREQIEAKDRAHAELQEAQRRLIELSRLSGMAEVATGVLHNVGNVLNSINVSASLFSDRLQASRVEQLRGLSQILKENQSSIGDFLTNDLRGQRVLPYLAKLSDHLVRERDEMGIELEDLLQHVGHVKEIVAMQQTYARASGVLEKLDAQSLIDDALSIMRAGMDRHRIDLTKIVETVPLITTDRHKVLQILLNLLRNAKDAVKASDCSPRQIVIRLDTSGDARVRYQVTDNGVGIAPENLARIFSHGFTTKKNGHGFGLHSGALAAGQLGGSLNVESEGLGHGATFTLELPLQAMSKDETREL